MCSRLKDTSRRPQLGRRYLCCGSCLRLGPASILGSRSISQWSCTAHTAGCTLGDGYSSPPPHRSCCWSLGEAPGDKNTRLLSPVPRYTGDCSRLWPRDTNLWREARNVKRGGCGNNGTQMCQNRIYRRLFSVTLRYYRDRVQYVTTVLWSYYNTLGTIIWRINVFIK